LSSGAEQQGDIDFGERRLCTDGACIGVLTPDGRCPVCGRREQAPLAAAPFRAPAAEERDDFDERELCPDGVCVGVLGPAGTCKVCGRTGAPS
jgi:hypothetical protein